MFLNFISKAQNLKNLKGRLESARILPLVIVKKSEISQIDEIFNKILAFGVERLIIRSSSKSEDSKESSNAGAFLSIANVECEKQSIISALQKVADSMPSFDDEILIQPHLQEISMCGVGFSVDKDNFAPYFCIQFDKSGKNDSITDGSAKELCSFFHFRDKIEVKDSNMSQVIAMIRELEGIFDCNFLDVEFAFSGGVLYCLQVRPLVMKEKQNYFNVLSYEALERLQRRFLSLQTNKPDILGERGIFGVMPDWNPAEIIGLKPKRLALSLYKEIITDRTWAYQRNNYGYLDLRSHPLMYSFLGIPYIDVRVSFNSFIPKDLDKKIARKLVNYYLDTLYKNPQLHDKVEFEIVFSCYDFATPKKLQKLLNFGFNENEIKRLEFSLLELTNSIIKDKKGLYVKDIKKIKLLKKRFLNLLSLELKNIDKIYWLIEECKRYGTLPFAGLARAGFIAVQMLNSLVEIGFLNKEQRAAFLRSLNTISKQLSLKSSQLNEQNKGEFLAEFGHLRAGTYNILSPRYDEEFDKYFNLDSNLSNLESSAPPFVLDERKSKELDAILLENGLKISSKEFFSFLKVAIEGREYAKFEFTKLLSSVLVEIGNLGEHYGISKDDMAHLDIKSILNLYASLYSKSPKERILDEIARHKEEYELTLALKLPPLLRDVDEIFSFSVFEILPNFISQKCVCAEVFVESRDNGDLKDKIVLIKAADPGYDYLFTKQIAGFITCYGGANSHMAIRASELGIPAVIGVGEEAFLRYCNASKITIDCQSEQILCL